MIDVYCKLIINGRRTFDKIPGEFQESVQLRLLEMGYGIDGRMLNDE